MTECFGNSWFENSWLNYGHASWAVKPVHYLSLGAKTNPHHMGSLLCRSLRKQIHTTWGHPVARCENRSTRRGVTPLPLGAKTNPHDMGRSPLDLIREQRRILNEFRNNSIKFAMV